MSTVIEDAVTAADSRSAPFIIKDIRASVHTISVSIPLLSEKIAGFGREEQQEFVFCEVETVDFH